MNKILLIILVVVLSGCGHDPSPEEFCADLIFLGKHNPFGMNKKGLSKCGNIMTDEGIACVNELKDDNRDKISSQSLSEKLEMPRYKSYFNRCKTNRIDPVLDSDFIDKEIWGR